MALGEHGLHGGGAADPGVRHGEGALRPDVAGEGGDRQLGFDVGDGEDGAGRAERAGRGQQPRRADVQRAGEGVERAQQPRRVAGGVLDADDTDIGEARQRVDVDARRRHRREVVGEHGDVAGRPHDLGVVADRIGCSGGRQHEQTIGGSTGHDLGGEVRSLAGRRRPGADDHGHVGGQRLADDLGERDPLGTVQRRRLAGRPGDDDRPHPDPDQVGRQPGRGREVDLAFVVEQRHEGHADAGEQWCYGHGSDVTARPADPGRSAR